MTARSKSRGLHPDFCFHSTVDIRPAWLTTLGVHGVLLDIDNTITRWEERLVPPAELSWIKNLISHGIAIRMLSNGLPAKLAAVERQTGLQHVAGRPMKPLPGAFLRGLRELKLAPDAVMMIGDSVVTDIWCANRLGLWTCLVEPLSSVDFAGSKLHRIVEQCLRLRRPVDPQRDFRTVPAP